MVTYAPLPMKHAQEGVFVKFSTARSLFKFYSKQLEMKEREREKMKNK
jgi:hypothetical protein